MSRLTDRLLLIVFIVIYTVVSIILFDNIYETSDEIIDELFHIGQGLQYCRERNFTAWDPKITTFPGLYLLSSVIPPEYCHTHTLRMVPLVCSIINIWLIYEIKSMMLFDPKRKNSLDVLLETITLALLPPLYFFAHVYYTDVPAITTVLLMLLFSFRKLHFLSAVFGACSVMMRQTNIVWVAGTLGVHLVDKMMLKIYPKLRRDTATLGNFLFALKSHLKQPKLLFSFIFGAIREFFMYILVICAFIVFLYVNGSIVVGDKSAHEAAVHLPQLFYFSLFVLIFGASLWVPTFLNAHKIAGSWKCIFGILVLAGVIAVVVQYNTIVHPYLLADNRHYTFYVWNRFFGRYEMAKFVIIPVYIFGLGTIYNSLDGSIGFKIFYSISTLLTLCLQQMIEVRYFLVPFLLLRLNRKSVSKIWTIFELANNILINHITFSIFFSVDITWKDFDSVQKIIW